MLRVTKAKVTRIPSTSLCSSSPRAASFISYFRAMEDLTSMEILDFIYEPVFRPPAHRPHTFLDGNEQRSGRYQVSDRDGVEAAHRVLPFVNRFGFPNRKWDNRNMMMIYDREQSRSALPIMRTKIEDGMHKDKAGCMRLSAGGRKRGAAASVAGTCAGSQGWGASSGVAGDGDS